ncbi:MAG: class I SAM-dependent methyltransferase [Methanobacterium sp.]
MKKHFEGENNKMDAWKNPSIVNNFLTNTRKSMPLGREQFDILLRLISKSQTDVNNFIDLGCGDGILANTILTQYPDANGLLLDYSSSMIDAAKDRMSDFQNQRIIQSDLSKSNWQDNVTNKPEVVVSGYAIHHLKNRRKYELFEEIFEILKPDGIFINMDHVASTTSFGNSLFNDLMVDALYIKLKDEGKEKSRIDLLREYVNRPDQYDNILLPVTMQCDWLKEIGYSDVDCYFKCFELAIYAGIKNK